MGDVCNLCYTHFSFPYQIYLLRDKMLFSLLFCDYKIILVNLSNLLTRIYYLIIILTYLIMRLL